MEEGRKATTMSVAEMRSLLGIRKTESYWLINKHYFKTFVVKNRRRVDIESFEKWYAGQVKHKKVNGPPPGEELRKSSYSVHDIADILDVQTDVVYSVIKRDHIQKIVVDDWIRIPKDEFEKWYNAQKKYRTAEDREKDCEMEENSLTFPEMAKELGISRSNAYSILKGKDHDRFEFVVIAERKRVTRESFERWYAGQDRYVKVSERNQ